MRKIFAVLFFAFCAANAHAACPAAYPNNVSGTDICYLITKPGEYVASPGAGAAPCPIGDYCPGGDKIYNITIPERYTPVEYLENNSTAYIDTGHIPTPATTVNADVLITGGINYATSNQSPWVPFLGTMGTGNTVSRYAFFIHNTDGIPNFDYFNRYLETYTAGGNFMNKRFSMKTQISNNQILTLVDNVVAYSTPVVSPAPNFTDGIALFTMARDSYRHALARFYSYQAYESDNLVQSMIPVYDTESKLYGMYDMVSHKFFGSANADKFTGGPVVATVSLPDFPTRGGNFSCAAKTDNEFTVSPPKSESVTDCGRILHIGSNKIYMRRRKIAPHALAARVGDNIFYAEMTTENCGHVRIRLDGVVYSICNTSAD